MDYTLPTSVPVQEEAVAGQQEVEPNLQTGNYQRSPSMGCVRDRAGEPHRYLADRSRRH